MKTLFFYILFGFLTGNCIGQQQLSAPHAKFITSLPFRLLNGGVILLKAQLNNLPDSFNFILDTGSGSISLDSTTCAKYNISHSPSGKTINGIAGIMEVDSTSNKLLTFRGLKVEHLDFYVNNYEILTSVYGEKIDGIIGYSFLSRYILKVNFDSLKIEIYEPGKIKYPSGGYIFHPVFTTLPIHQLQIKDSRTVNANFYLDTGAGLCFLLSKNFVTDSTFIMKKRKFRSIEAQGLGGKKHMDLTITKEVKIGPYRFRMVPTYILDDEYNATSYPYIAGLIGNDLLRRFNLIINYPNKEFFLQPNSHFRETFDYSYTGLSIYYIDGRIVIDDVVKGSPADKAKLKKDDVIYAINNNFSNNITVYKNILQNADQIVKILIIRDTNPMIISFKVGRIF